MGYAGELDKDYCMKVYRMLNKGDNLMIEHLKVLLCGIENLYLDTIFNMQNGSFISVYPEAMMY